MPFEPPWAGALVFWGGSRRPCAESLGPCGRQGKPASHHGPLAKRHAAFRSDPKEDQKALDYLSFSFAIVAKAWQKLPTAVK
jgi:hypothetical protein